MADQKVAKKKRAPKRGDTAMQVLENVDLTGKFILITGANQGIGFETARALALHNASVTITCRNADAGQRARDSIIHEYPKAQVSILSLDLADLASVEQCAQEYISSGKPLHILILNAGLVTPLIKLTDAGFETTFQVNHLAHFYLTKLLTDRLISSAPARVVVVSSDMHRSIRSMHRKDITWEKFSPTSDKQLNKTLTAYSLSKFCNVVFASELNRRLSSKRVYAFSLHPGLVGTNIISNNRLMKCFMCVSCTSDTVEESAATSVYVATKNGLETVHPGGYFRYCQARTPTVPCGNSDNWKAVWELSEEMLKYALKGEENQEIDAKSERKQLATG